MSLPIIKILDVEIDIEIFRKYKYSRKYERSRKKAHDLVSEGKLLLSHFFKYNFCDQRLQYCRDLFYSKKYSREC